LWSPTRRTAVSRTSSTASRATCATPCPTHRCIGFTGTPIDAADKSTRSVFGDYVSVYDIQRTVEDGATVPIYYESRLAKLALKEDERPHLDDAFDELTEGEELEGREKLKTKWSALEALVGTDRRVQLIAKDLVEHFEARLEAMDGKAMLRTVLFQYGGPRLVERVGTSMGSESLVR